MTGAVRNIAAIAGKLENMLSAPFKEIDAQAKFADRIGVTQKALAGLELANREAGNSTQTLNMGLQRMTRRVSEAAMGTGEAQGALKELGIDARRLAGLRPEQQFAVISEAMRGVGNQGDKVRLAMRLFDSEGVALLNTMKGGAAALNEAQAAAEKFGTALSRSDAAKIEKANDAMGRVGEMLRGIKNQIAVGLAPAVEWVSKKITDFGLTGDGIAAKIRRGFELAGAAIQKIGRVLSPIKMVFSKIAEVGGVIYDRLKIMAMAAVEFGGQVLDYAAPAIQKASEWVSKLIDDFDVGEKMGKMFDFLEKGLGSVANGVLRIRGAWELLSAGAAYSIGEMLSWIAVFTSKIENLWEDFTGKKINLGTKSIADAGNLLVDTGKTGFDKADKFFQDANNGVGSKWVSNIFDEARKFMSADPEKEADETANAVAKALKFNFPGLSPVGGADRAMDKKRDLTMASVVGQRVSVQGFSLNSKVDREQLSELKRANQTLTRLQRQMRGGGEAVFA